LSSETRYFRVGLFVFLGIIAIVAALVVLGGRSFFQEQALMETYFQESVQGLEVGSPVKLRGVQLGSVSEIGFVGQYYPLSEADENRFGQLVLVRMKLIPRRRAADPEERIAAMVRRGLRLRLSKGAITGTAFIEADYFDPEKNPPMEITWKPEELYVPSTPSTLATLSSAAGRLVERLEGLRIEELVDNVNTLVVNVDGAVRKLDVAEFRRRGTTLVEELRGLSTELRTSLEQADLPGLSASAREALTEANAALERVSRAVDGSRYDLEVTLENLRVTTDSLRELTETLRAQPSLLLRSAPPPRDGEAGSP
jgi:ABC-type transporter Mla subunit MlaD